MKKTAILLTVCLLALGLIALAENLPTQPQEDEDASAVWRGEVTAVGADGITLKLAEYNPENPLLPEDEQPDSPEGSEEEAPQGDGEEAPGSAARGRSEGRGFSFGGPSFGGGFPSFGNGYPSFGGEDDRDFEGDYPSFGGDFPSFDEDFPSFDGDFPSFDGDDERGFGGGYPFFGGDLPSFDGDDERGFGGNAPVNSITITVDENTRYYVYEDGAYTDAALLDVSVGDMVTVRTEDGVAQVVVIESGAEARNSSPAGGGHSA